jgi:hypothetical protein
MGYGYSADEAEGGNEKITVKIADLGNGKFPFDRVGALGFSLLYTLSFIQLDAHHTTIPTSSMIFIRLDDTYSFHFLFPSMIPTPRDPVSDYRTQQPGRNTTSRTISRHDNTGAPKSYSVPSGGRVRTYGASRVWCVAFTYHPSGLSAPNPHHHHPSHPPPNKFHMICTNTDHNLLRYSNLSRAATTSSTPPRARGTAKTTTISHRLWSSWARYPAALRSQENTAANSLTGKVCYCLYYPHVPTSHPLRLSLIPLPPYSISHTLSSLCPALFLPAPI